ncbi:pyruvate dehydrogenase [acetyl-transferring]-phosphatase 1, mitochondrial-like [Dendronephthya gigantea]|uniref:pyruvate dehydrogenase [acetyl-transferring]-phosphatase 1, mitochondrial-like n=1 Tax=Dendronephthya gigantea TaxID=151771 RepID=UPI001069343B|nr:pyruvate dehydrogenase [acetyl-transferring]-phosphatase 1, mitochondrial-like [Dendronephthya gigantea]XP_028415363.1 pyruvate dehydrogenase [acetyl-transferring]-phosphatase 1, mitochondrial-like [Dendronephthya gigantea]
MPRFTVARRRPYAAGVVAAFGLVWLTCKDQFYHSNSYSNLLWHYLVPSFLKSSSSPSLPWKNSRDPQTSRKLPHVEIRRNEKFIPVNSGVVSHYESNNLPSNDPMEDRNGEYRVSDGLIFGVFDGHSGWQCAEEVMNRLPYYTALSLQSENVLDKTFSRVNHLDKNLASSKNVKDILGPKAHIFLETVNSVNQTVEQQLKNAYTLLDEDIVYEALPEVNGYDNEKIMKGLSGACALTAYIHNNDLYVSNSGDCRAVLGSRSPDGKWLATSLSLDQNAQNNEEVERIRMEHPGEELIIWNGRLLGHLMPFRAFGDVIFKWSAQMHKEFLNKVYGRVVIPPQVYRTPPYLTAEPVVAHHTLESKDKFLVIASDGLWDMMSSDDAVQYVGNVLDSGNVSGYDQDGSVVRFNAASQLIQQALGGDDEVKVAKLLNAPKHVRRAVRDDITVTVVYFKNL